MSIRNLHHALRPRSVAVIGASDRPGSRGEAVMRNLLAGGFEGRVHPVNPRRDTVMGLPCAPSPAALPEAPDLTAIVTPAALVPDAVAALGARGGRVAAVLSPGVDGALRQAMLDAARPHLLRLIGPDTMGLMIPGVGLDLSLAHLPARPGRLALVSQSGAIATALVDWAAEREIGFSHVLGLGGMADVDLGDALDLLAGEGAARAILVYFETAPAARKLLSAARAAARLKPVIALVGGGSAAAAAAAATHTGALATPDVVIDAALRRAGVLRVRSLDALFAAAETVARFGAIGQARLAIVSNGGGAGVLAVDRLAADGGSLAELSPATIEALARVLPQGWSGANPVDILGDAPPERFVAALGCVAEDAGVDVVLVINCPTGIADGAAAAQAVAAAAEGGRIGGKPLIAAWLGGADARRARAALRAAGVASFGMPDAAAEAVGHLTDWSRAQGALLRVPDRAVEDERRGAAPDARGRVQDIFRAAAAAGRGLLSAPEAAAALAAYGVPVAPSRVASGPPEAGAVARAMLQDGGALALKLVSRDVSHKSDVGGVALDLATPEAVEAAAEGMAARLRAATPAARLEGFQLQPMIRRPLAQEVILGVAHDRSFGPVILFGAGGVAVEILGDTAVALPPLDGDLAAELVLRTRVGRLLAGFRARAPADLAALGFALVALSHMIEDLPALRALDVNPLLVDAQGVIALDVRIEFDAGALDVAPPNPSLAIRPYPASWRREVALKDGRYLIRAILPLDVRLYPEFFARLDANDVRMRFMAPRKHFPDEMGLRLTQLDYDRDMAFVAIAPDGTLAGVARLSCQPDRDVAEYALVVRSDLAGRGIGSALLGQLIDYARADGIRRLEGMILAENRPMRGLVERFGFLIASMPDEPGVVMSGLQL